MHAINRRRWLSQTAAGFGTVGLASALAAAAAPMTAGREPLHLPPRARRVIFLFMNGGPSHVDTFDPKPALAEYAGDQPSGKLYKPSKGAGYMPSPFRFRPRGDSGIVMSDLFPRLAGVADELCVLRSMHTSVPNHEPGLLMMNCGNLQPVRPCLGSWLSYGLGSENENLPAFVTLCPGMPVVGPQLWSSSFLPGEHQATRIDTRKTKVSEMLTNLKHPELSRTQQRDQLDLLQKWNQRHARDRQQDAVLEEHIRTMEMAFLMQREASEAFDLQQEPDHIQEEYGNNTFGRGVLLARRLAERGVRMIQVYDVEKGKQPWDTHKDNNKRHEQLCSYSDQAAAALIRDLKRRGMLEDTLVIWGGEFGRTPYAQDQADFRKAGRDHHHTGFSMWMAGGGVRAGFTYGATDEFGMDAVENRMHVHDLHATVLHLMGIDHEQLTYRYSGRDFRLTDVHGRVVHDIMNG